ncbi:MAG TPA: glycerol-3-phosphate acyltransferase [Ilumatobacteraceae bacterium]|nr:glycerol-3-phosphate acyltransferase [Ilumatobacteraceae bacterium]
MVTRRSRVLVATAIGLGYVIGTFPTASIVARRVSGGTVDLRRSGSGNPGSANALGVLGAKAGAVVLVGDVGKGAAACVLGGLVGGPTGAHLAGTAAVAGHCYPVWNGFAGGKGVATSVGQCLATLPAYFPIDAAVAVATASSSRWRQRAFAATVVSSTCWVLGSILWWRRRWPNPWGPPATGALPIATAASTSMILQRFVAAQRRADAQVNSAG